MIRTSENTADQVAACDQLPLAAMLRRQRRRWVRAFEACQEHFSTKAVHQVRVQSRRLLAVLELARVVLSSRQVDAVTERVKAVLKRFGGLRDVQVQLELLPGFGMDGAQLRPLRRHLERRERRWTRRLARDLKVLSAAHSARAVAGLERELGRNDDRDVRAARQAQRVLAAVDQAQRKVMSLQGRAVANRPATLHRVRVAFKRFRYMVEALKDEVPGITKGRVKALQRFQTRLGDVQDLEVFEGRIAKFESREPDQAATMCRLREAIEERRARLVRLHMSQAGELEGFWPPGRKGDAAATTRSRGPARRVRASPQM